jgi:hypothetical protein
VDLSDREIVNPFKSVRRAQMHDRKEIGLESTLFRRRGLKGALKKK